MNSRTLIIGMTAVGLAAIAAPLAAATSAQAEEVTSSPDTSTQIVETQPTTPASADGAEVSPETPATGQGTSGTPSSIDAPSQPTETSPQAPTTEPSSPPSPDPSPILPSSTDTSSSTPAGSPAPSSDPAGSPSTTDTAPAPDPIVEADLHWLLPDGGTAENVTWPQAPVDPTTCVPSNPGTIQNDHVRGTQAQIDALTSPDSPAGRDLAQGEDSAIIVSWSFSTQTVCAPTAPPAPPVVVTPPAPPVVVTPPVTPAPPVIHAPAPAPTVTTAAKKTTAAPAPLVTPTPKALAFTGSEHTGDMGAGALGLIGLGAFAAVGSAIARRRAARRS